MVCLATLGVLLDANIFESESDPSTGFVKYNKQQKTKFKNRQTYNLTTIYPLSNWGGSAPPDPLNKSASGLPN